jgi:hypothetical protein
MSGYVAVAFDAMRDVLEIENLLRDFANQPANVDAWLTADEKTLLKKFSPVKVRERLHAGQDRNLAQAPESVDYRGHSMALHVGPHRTLIPDKGLGPEKGWDSDIGFWEMFEHARRLLLAIETLTGALAPNSDADKLAREEPAAVQEGWRQTLRLFKGTCAPIRRPRARLTRPHTKEKVKRWTRRRPFAQVRHGSMIEVMDGMVRA